MNNVTCPREGQRVTVTPHVVTGKVFYVNSARSYFEMTRAEDGKVVGFYTENLASVGRALPTRAGDAVWAEGRLWRRGRLESESQWSARSPNTGKMVYRNNDGIPFTWVPVVVDGKLVDQNGRPSTVTFPISNGTNVLWDNYLKAGV